MWPQACPEDASQLSSLFSVNCIKTYHPIFHPERGRASSHLPRPAGEWGGGSQRRQVLSVSQRCHLWEHLWEGREGGLWGSKKICNCFFSIPVSLSSSAVLWAAPSNSSPPAPAMQRLSRRFPGPGELQRAAGKQIGSKKGQELGQAQRQVEKEEKNKEKSKLCPKASSCRSVLFFFSTLIF